MLLSAVVANELVFGLAEDRRMFIDIGHLGCLTALPHQNHCRQFEFEWLGSWHFLGISTFFSIAPYPPLSPSYLVFSLFFLFHPFSHPSTHPFIHPSTHLHTIHPSADGWLDGWLDAWLGKCVCWLLVVAWAYGRLSHARGPCLKAYGVLRHARDPAGLLPTNNQHTLSTNHASNYPSIQPSVRTLTPTFIHPSIHSLTLLFTHPPSVRSLAHPLIHPFAHPNNPSSIHTPIHPPVHTSIHPPIQTTLHLSTHTSAHPNATVFHLARSQNLFIYPSTHPSAHPNATVFHLARSKNHRLQPQDW